MLRAYNFGLALLAEGDYDAALTQLQLAADGWEQRLGADHPSVAISTNNIGTVLIRLGRNDEARVNFARALEIWEAKYGAEHLMVAYALVGLAEVDAAAGRLEDAERQARRAISIREANEVEADLLAEAQLGAALIVDVPLKLFVLENFDTSSNLRYGVMQIICQSMVIFFMLLFLSHSFKLIMGRNFFCSIQRSSIQQHCL